MAKIKDSNARVLQQYLSTAFLIHSCPPIWSPSWPSRLPILSLGKAFRQDHVKRGVCHDPAEGGKASVPGKIQSPVPRDVQWPGKCKELSKIPDVPFWRLVVQPRFADNAVAQVKQPGALNNQDWGGGVRV